MCSSPAQAKQGKTKKGHYLKLKAKKQGTKHKKAKKEEEERPQGDPNQEKEEPEEPEPNFKPRNTNKGVAPLNRNP